MVRARRSRTKKVSVGRFDGELEEFEVPLTATVSAILETAGVSLADEEELLNSNGEEITMETVVSDGEEILIAGRYKSGVNF